MIIGLPQGFVRFGEMAHKILVAIHTLGPMRLRDLHEEFGNDRKAIGMMLFRLEKHGFIFPQEVIPQAVSGDKTQRVFGLQPPKYRKKYKPVSGKERQQRCRDRRKMRAASVFDFRGQMKIYEENADRPSNR